MTKDMYFNTASSNLSMPTATVIPVIHYQDVPEATKWLCTAFGFNLRLQMASHRAQLNVGDGAIVVAKTTSQSQNHTSGISIMVRVSNIDAHCEMARSNGAQIISEPTSQPYGERQYSAIDIDGYLWTFSQTEFSVQPSAWGGTLMQS